MKNPTVREVNIMSDCIFCSNDRNLETIFEEVRAKIPTSIRKTIDTKSDRNKLIETCGNDAFLMPEKLKFPVKNIKTCEYDCRLLYAAYIRAKQFHYTDIAEKAKKLLKETGCSEKIRVTLENEYNESISLLQYIDDYIDDDDK